MKTIKQLAQEALDLQDACNFSGVAHTLWRTSNELREQSAPDLSKNAILTVILDKLVNLTTGGNVVDAYQAYTEVHRLAGR
jgi:hypothetical protein